MSGVEVALAPGSTHGAEGYDLRGLPLTVQWLRSGAALQVDNGGAPGTFGVTLQVATTTPRVLRLLVNDRLAREAEVSTVLWTHGYTALDWDVDLAAGVNRLAIATDRPPDRLSDGREVTFLLIGDVVVTPRRAASAPRTAPADPDWLDRVPTDENGFLLFSERRAYSYDESAYDAQYDIKPDLARGSGVNRLLEGIGADTSGPAIEIGCGTGTLSLGLVASSAHPCVLLTDASDAFLKITREKLRRANVDVARTRFGVLLGEEIGRLPEESVSLVVLRSALHHVVDVPAFIRSAARVLRPGGVLTFEEPCAEGYVLMGALARLLPDAAAAHGRPLTAKHAETVDAFAGTMLFYARTDVDKSAAEDKHLFRLEELQRIGGGASLSVELHPNVTYDACASGVPGRRHRSSFEAFFRDYLKYCMSWDEELLSVFDLALRPRLSDLELLAGQGAGPAMHGVFVCKKADRRVTIPG